MVPYTVNDRDDHGMVHFILAVVAVVVWGAAAWAFSEWTEGADPMVLAIVPMPSGLALYSLLLRLFETRLWARPRIRKLLGIPDLQGEWRGTRTKEGDPVPRQFKLVIKQNWSKISIETYNEGSCSYATSAAFLRTGDRVEFIFTCQTVRLKPVEPGRDQNPRGTQTWILSRNEMVLEGPYYSNNTKEGTEWLRRRSARC